MAGLPPDGRILVQQNDGIVTVFDSCSQEEYIRFNPSDMDDAAKAQLKIFACQQLTDEQKCFAHFWSGYFYAHAGA